MRDVFLDLLYACGGISGLAITIAIVKAAHDYVRGKMFQPKPQVFLTTATAGTTAGATATTSLSANFIAPAPQPVQTAPVLVQKVEPVDSTFPPPEPRESVPPQNEFLLECGNCHKNIKTPPIKVDAKGPGKTEMRYRCEHCGATVAVKV